MPSSSEIRQQFIDFFLARGHVNVASSPVVPLDDPTLLFVNAGMNQFKPYFLGTEKPKNTRVANTQKCIRAGGKHNDLDDVGRDTYHHTFFEMLGNWSFGDYFKQDAISWAWELLTKVWALDPTRLHVTVFEGDPANGIPRDDEAAEIWKSVGVDPKHIHLGNKKDNFWEMGDTGPCGPCTEIHIDRTPDKTGGTLVNAGSEQCIEIWNNVFIQFNRNPDKSLTPLPAKHVDTGMGFERICGVLQGKNSNYDTDVFAPIFSAIQHVTGAKPYGGKLDEYKTNQLDIAYRVIADHIRTLTFALTDGATIGNVGRDYVLRRVLRRAERYGRQYLGATKPFLHSLVPTLIEHLGVAFPELKRNPEKIREQIYSEEEGFLRTLDRGMKLFTSFALNAIADEVAKARSSDYLVFGYTVNKHTENGGQHTGALDAESLFYSGSDGKKEIISFPSSLKEQKTFIKEQCRNTPKIHGADAFKLHDTFGLLIDITIQMSEELGITVDEDRFKTEMEDARTRARKGGKNHTVVAVKGELPATDDSPKYDADVCEAKVLGWVIGSDVIRSGSLKLGETAALLLDRTNFYAEQGGQVGDTGIIDEPGNVGVEFQVEDTQRLGDAVLHFGTVLEGEIKVGDAVRCVQSTMRRVDVMRNHTATHLLNLTLRQVLGQHVEQKGSLVDDEKTRFDFSHDKPISGEEVREIERRVNEAISKDQPVTAITMPLAEAKQIEGVRAVFGEKYPDPVRVVLIGPESPQLAKREDSVEFCGGTHMPRTGSLGYFKILSHEPVAKGVRRLTAVTGRVAADRLQLISATIEDLSTKFVCKPDELAGRIDALLSEVKTLKDAVAKTQAAGLASAVDELLAKAETKDGTKYVIGQLPAANPDAYKTQIDRVKKLAGSAAIVFGIDEGEKATLLVALTPDLVKKGMKAGEIIKPLVEMLGGHGGGKPEMAQGGGSDVAKLLAALAKAKDLAQASLPT